MHSFSLIVAATENNGIGRNGIIPWNLPDDIKFFKEKTSKVEDGDKKNCVIMGRKTWESITFKYRPLKGRINVILSRDEEMRKKYCVSDDVIVCGSFKEALESLSSEFKKVIEKIFVIGGGSIYEESLKYSEYCENIFITRLYDDIDCDTFFPIFSRKQFSLVTSSDIRYEKNIKYQFLRFQNVKYITGSTGCSENTFEDCLPLCLQNKPHEEYQYLNLIRKIIDHGKFREDRTGTGTMSIFGATMRFSLQNNVIPLLTTKRVFWRGVVEELLWFISGDTNANTLRSKDVHIWDGNSSREYFDKIGLGHREEGDLGPVYGFQWRHYGAKYLTMHDDYADKGIDQLKNVINLIKTDPTSRRIILTAWNPSDISLMALPPCHMFCQFFVDNGELSCQMYQRSADMGLGVPFNIASYALLTIIVAKCTNLKAGEFIHVIGDAHVYLDHIEPLKEQLGRKPRSFPRLSIVGDNTDIDKFNFSDFILENYNPHVQIKMKMAV